MKVIVAGSAEGFRDVQSRHSSGKKVFDIADVGIDSCVPATDAAVAIRDHYDRLGPLSTLGFVGVVWTTILTVAEILVERGVKLHIHPSHNIPGDTTAHERLDAALVEYRRRIAGV